MTTSKQIPFGPLAEAASLRIEIAARAAEAHRAACRVRSIVAAAIALATAVRVACLLKLLPWPWLNDHGAAISLSILAASLLLAATVWSSRQRLELAQATLDEFLLRLPSR
jgi:hypothetical protein